jgi:hypothetical protein
MVMSVIRASFVSDVNKFIGTLVGLLVYYGVFEIIYQITYFATSKLLVLNKETGTIAKPEVNGKQTDHRSLDITFSALYHIVLLIFFSSCLALWNVLLLNAMYRKQFLNVKQIVTSAFVGISLIGNSIAFVKARDFVIETFHLKNAEIDRTWNRLVIRLRMLCRHNRIQ